VDEVADHHGVIITFEDASTSIARLEIDITKTITLRRPNKRKSIRNVRNAKSKVDKLMKEKQLLTSNTSRTGRTSVRTSRATDTDALSKLCDDIVDAKIELRSAKSAEKEVKDESDAVHTSFEKWKEQFPHRTPASLRAS